MQRLLLVLLVLLLPAFAAAQATGFQSHTFTTGNATVNADDCEVNEAITVVYVLDADLVDTQTVTAFTTDGATCTTSAAVISELEVNVAQASVTVYPIEDLVDSCDDHPATTRTLCLVLEDDAGGREDLAIAIEIDTERPAPPDELNVDAGDGGLTITWSYSDTVEPDDLEFMQIHYQPVASTGDASSQEVSAATGRGRVTGLSNSTEYEIWVVPVDDAGNEGDPSEPTTASPVPSQDFWELYVASAGGEAGGCSSASGAGLPGLLLVLAGLVLAVRRRGRAGLLAVLLASSAVALPALPAQAQEGSGVDGWTDPERRYWLELDFGPYRPEVDDEFGGSGPYQAVFGSGSELLFRIRAERAIWQGIGQVDLGLSAGFAQAVGKALLEGGGGVSEDTTVFNWTPLQLAATYRLDYAAIHWNVPFVPFVRVGLNPIVWWVLDNTGDVAEAGGREAVGMRWGFSYGGGLMFLLDVLDPRLAKDFARSSGVDNSYLYAEVTRLEVDGFGADGFVLSDTTWFAGLAVEF